MIPIEFRPGINDLEECILKGAISAQKEYKEVTDGWWLWHGPESFLQVVVAKSISKETGHAVYIDASRSRIERERGRGPGRPAGNGLQRADISVWFKSNNNIGLRAVVEIKRSIGIKPVVRDTQRMDRWMRQNNPPKAAYMLGYSEAKGDRRLATLKRRFTHWNDTAGWLEKGNVIFDDPDDLDWAWGFILMRHPG